MSLYLATWEFNKKRPLYYAAKRKKLLAAFRNLNWKKDTELDSVVFIEYPGTAQQLYNYLGQCFDQYDRLAVTKITSTDSRVFLTSGLASWVGARW